MSAITSVSQISELPPPGTRVVQQFQTASPVALLPNLPAVIVGVCKEIHELRTSAGDLNTDILLSGPAVATADNDEASYTTMASLTLQVRVNSGVIQTFTMPASAGTMTAQQVAIAINGHSPAPADFAAYAYENQADSKNYLQLRSLATGETRTIQIVGGTAVSKFGWGAGRTFYGTGSYIQDSVYLKQEAFPDPRGITDERDIDEDSIRAFVDLGTTVRELLRTETFLRKDSYSSDPNYGVMPYNDGDGDQTTPFVDLKDSAGLAVNLVSGAGAASVTGVVDLNVGAGIPIHGETLILQVDGAPAQRITFFGQPILTDDTSGFTWTTIQSGDMDITVNGVTETITFSGSVADIATLITELNTFSVANFGVNIAYRCDQYGAVDVAGDYVGLWYGADPAVLTENTEVVVPAQANAASNEIMGDALEHVHVNWGDKPHANWPVEDIVGQINALFPSTVASLSTNFLKLTSPRKGYESKIEIDTSSSAIGAPQPNPTTLLGLDIDTTNKFYGSPFPARVGDALYGDGGFLGNIIEVHSGATAGRVRLDAEVSISSTWTAWYIVSKNLDAFDPTTEWGITVPTPDLYLDANNDLHLKHDFVRDTSGLAVETVTASLYIMFNALRLDVTSEAADPGLVSYSSETTLETELGPISPDNPLTYGIWLAMQAAPSVTIYGLGVSETSADKPYGTIEGFSKAYDYLEAQSAYAIAQMSSDQDIASLGKTHVLAMSDPDQGQVRIVICHNDRPTHLTDDIVASGNDGDSVPGGPPEKFDTKIATLSQDLLALDVDPNSITVSDGVYLDFADDDKRWNVTTLENGTVLTINTTFAAGENDDDYYGETGIPDDLVSATFSVKKRGSAVSDTDDEVVALYNRAVGMGTRRLWFQMCDKVRASVSGVDQLIEGFFACAVKAGMVTGLVPGTPMSKMTMPVFTGVTGTNKVYKNSQLNQIAAGGNDIIVAASDTSVQSRHQLTTDTSTVEQMEQSITVALDFVEIFMRQNLDPYSGKFNITDTMLGSLSMIAEGLVGLIVDTFKVVNKAKMTALTQSPTNPTRMLATLRVTPFYPGNTFDITMII